MARREKSHRKVYDLLWRIYELIEIMYDFQFSIRVVEFILNCPENTGAVNAKVKACNCNFIISFDLLLEYFSYVSKYIQLMDNCKHKKMKIFNFD